MGNAAGEGLKVLCYSQFLNRCTCCLAFMCGSATWVRRAWLPTPVFLPEKSPGQRSLVGYCPRGRKESDTTEHTRMLLLLLEGNDVNLDQYGQTMTDRGELNAELTFI